MNFSKKTTSQGFLWISSEDLPSKFSNVYTSFHLKVLCIAISNLKIFFSKKKTKVESGLSMSGVDALNQSKFTPIFKADSIELLKLFLEYDIHLPLICGLLDAF